MKYSKRKFLTTVATLKGGSGIVAAVIPLIRSQFFDNLKKFFLL